MKYSMGNQIKSSHLYSGRRVLRCRSFLVYLLLHYYVKTHKKYLKYSIKLLNNPNMDSIYRKLLLIFLKRILSTLIVSYGELSGIVADTKAWTSDNKSHYEIKLTDSSWICQCLPNIKISGSLYYSWCLDNSFNNFFVAYNAFIMKSNSLFTYTRNGYKIIMINLFKWIKSIVWKW